MNTKGKFRLKNDKSLDLEIILDPKKNALQRKTAIIQEMREVTNKSWFDFKEVTFKWFDLADILLILRDKGEMVAFSANKFMGEHLIIFLSTMVIPELQGLDIAKKLQKIATRKLLKRNFHTIGFRVWKYFKPLYLTYRTPNPRLINAVKKYKVALPIGRQKPTLKETEIAKKVAEIFSPDCSFDSEYFIIEGVFQKSPELIYKEDGVPWSGDQKIDKFCEEYLGYKYKKGNLFVVVAHLTLWQQFLLLLSSFV